MNSNNWQVVQNKCHIILTFDNNGCGKWCCVGGGLRMFLTLYLFNCGSLFMTLFIKQRNGKFFSYNMVQ